MVGDRALASDEIGGGADVSAVLATAKSEVSYVLSFVLETLTRMLTDGTLYESGDMALRPTNPEPAEHVEVGR